MSCTPHVGLSVGPDCDAGGSKSTKLQSAIEMLLLQSTIGRWVLPGNVVAIRALGTTSLARVERVQPGAQNPAEVTEATEVKLMSSTADTPDLESYAQHAAEAAAAASDEGNTDAAASAAYRAALAGERSIGLSFLDIGGAADQVSFPAFRPKPSVSTLRKIAMLCFIAVQIRALRQLVIVPLGANAVFAKYGLQPPAGVLLHGPPGTIRH